MDDVVSGSLPPPPLPSCQKPLVRRRNCISTSVVVPANLTLQHQSSSSAPISSVSSTSSSTSSSVDFDLISIKPTSYTSLKDLIPSVAVNSPKPKSPAQNQAQSGSEISIRNHLVKQAAWAYLQPMSTSLDSAGRSILHRLWVNLSCKNPIAALFSLFDRYVLRSLTGAFDWLLRSICLRSYR